MIDNKKTKIVHQLRKFQYEVKLNTITLKEYEKLISKYKKIIFKELSKRDKFDMDGYMVLFTDEELKTIRFKRKLLIEKQKYAKRQVAAYNTKLARL
jgi:hypothetical protein